MWYQPDHEAANAGCPLAAGYPAGLLEGPPRENSRGAAYNCTSYSTKRTSASHHSRSGGNTSARQ